MWRKLALAGLTAFAAIAVFWSLSSLSEPLSLPNLPSEPAPNYVERRQGPPPPPPPPPSWEEFVAKVNGKQRQKPRM